MAMDICFSFYLVSLLNCGVLKLHICLLLYQASFFRWWFCCYLFGIAPFYQDETNSS